MKQRDGDIKVRTSSLQKKLVVETLPICTALRGLLQFQPRRFEFVTFGSVAAVVRLGQFPRSERAVRDESLSNDCGAEVTNLAWMG
jgi:hypothetical protein